MKAAPKTRARLNILNWIFEFSLPVRYGNYLSAHRTFTDDRNPPTGSLVAIQSAPVSKFYLSWVCEIKEESGWTNYLLESIEDNSLSWWSNVGMLVYDADTVAEHPEWRWTDKQFEFSDRWRSVCHKERNAFIVLPTGPTFNEDGSVTIGTRARYGADSYAPLETFPDWKRVTKKMMLEFYDKAVEERTSKLSVAMEHAIPKEGA